MLITKFLNRTSQEITLSNYIQTLSLKEKQKHFKEKHTTLLCLGLEVLY